MEHGYHASNCEICLAHARESAEIALRIVKLKAKNKKLRRRLKSHL